MAVELAQAYVSLVPSARGIVGKVGRELAPVHKVAGSEGEKAGKSFGSRFSSGVKKFTVGAAIGLGVAAAAAVKFGLDFVEAAEESRKVAKQTDAVLRSTGEAANISAKGVAELAGSISAKTGIDDEAIQSGENLLLTFTRVRDETGRGNDIFSQATGIITDMSVALGQDMSSSAIQVGKALNDPIKGMTALQRVGVTFTQQQKDQIAVMVASGDTLGAQKLILKELTTEFGGSAEAQATASDKLKVAFGNVAESIGGVLLPVVDKVADWLNDRIPAAQAVAKKAMDALSDGFKHGADGASGLVGFMQDVGRGARDVADWFTGTLVPAIRDQLVPWIRDHLVPQLRDHLIPRIADVVATVRDDWLPVFVSIYNFIKDKIVPKLGILADALGATFGSTAGVEITAIGVAIYFLAGAVTTANAALEGSALVGFLTWLGAGSLAFGAGVAIAAVVIFIGMWQLLKKVGINNLDQLIESQKQRWQDLKNIASGIWQGMQRGWDATTSFINRRWQVGWEGIRHTAVSIWHGLVDSWQAAVRGVKGAASGAVDYVQRVWHDRWSQVRGTAVNIWHGINGAWQAATGFVKRTASGAVDYVQRIWRERWGQVKATTVNVGNAIIRFFQGLPGRIAGAFGRAGRILLGAGKAIIDGLKNGAVAAWHAAADWFGSLKDKVVGIIKRIFHIGSPSKVMATMGGHVVTGFIKGLLTSTPYLTSAVKSLGLSAAQAFELVIGNLTGSAGGIGRAYLEAMRGGGGGTARWAKVAAAALAYTGQSSGWLSDLLTQMAHESGGNANAINLWDINAQQGHPSQGLMQVIPGTFKAFAKELAGRGILDPFANIVAAIRYTLSRYGTLGAWRRRGFQGYAAGSYEVGPGGGYTHPGEIVISRQAADIIRSMPGGPGGHSGAAVAIANVNLYDGVDVDLLERRLEFAVAGGRL